MENNTESISGYIVDVLNSKIYPGRITIENGRIKEIIRDYNKHDKYILPGFVDSHIHIESSMLVPSEFARAAVVHGTIATVSDPHEIGNVLGVEGVKYMIEDAKKVPMKFYFGAPSNVPATEFETSGGMIDSKDVEELLSQDGIKYLGEIMDFPAVVMKDSEVNNKIQSAKKFSKMIDGHAPGLVGEDLERYLETGITTEHECSTKSEAMEKLSQGIKIQIREGSVAKNFDDLISIINIYHKRCMFCSDDLHPNDLQKGHINNLVKRALSHGIDIMKILRVACINPVLHYGLDVGLLRIDDPADFIIVDNLKNFNVLRTYINGYLVAEDNRSMFIKTPTEIVNNFNINKKHVADFAVPYSDGKINVIEALEGQLITNKLVASPLVNNGYVVSDVNRDILKIAVVNRYKDAKITMGFVTNFGLKKGAIASSVAHDSHNIIAVGVTDSEICKAVNMIIKHKGGICAVSKSDNIKKILPLPIAGLMSDDEYDKVSEMYNEIDSTAKSFGSKLNSPVMTLSFMALLVIPNLKMSDLGLFDGEKSDFVDLFEN
jgi:adenine deaminase